MTTSLKPHSKLRVFRSEGGQRVPYAIELDKTLTVIAEYVDLPSVTQPLTPLTPQRSASGAEMSPERLKAMLMAKWATESVKENPIPNSEKFREEFFETKKKLVASYGDAPCPSCEIGKLIRGYRKKLEEQGLL